MNYMVCRECGVEISISEISSNSNKGRCPLCGKETSFFSPVFSTGFLADTLASNLPFWIMMTMGFVIVSSFLRVFNRGYYY